MLIAINILTALLTACYITLVLFFRRGWDRIRYFSPQGAVPQTFISVLIAARNEENNIEKTIRDILSQDYPPELFELIIADDHSTDRTAEMIRSYAGQGVKLISLNEKEPLNSYKKKAIAEAIGQARGELMVTTDADCRMGPGWLRTLALYYESTGYKMISSPVAYFEERSTFERMQSLEFLYLIGLGASTIGNRMPSTCNGANLAYRKDAFLEVSGFTGIDDLASGDDELLLHKVAERYPAGIGFCKSREAIVYTHAKQSISGFIQQRKRWASKSTKYKDKRIVALGVAIWLFNVMLVVNAALATVWISFAWTFALSLGLKFLVEMIFLTPLCSFARRHGLLWYQPVITIIHAFYFILIGILGNTGKYRWKGRLVK